MSNLVGITGGASVVRNDGDFAIKDIDVNTGFDAVTPGAGGAINTSVPAEISANGMNLPGAAQQHIIDPNAVGLANPGGTTFGGYSLQQGAPSLPSGNGKMDEGLGGC